MMLIMKIFIWTIIFIISNRLFGIDESNITERFFVVGVISESNAKNKQNGVVVLKDININKTFILKQGEFLPYSHWKVKSIQRQKVVVSNLGQDITLSYYFDNASANTKNIANTYNIPLKKPLNKNSYFNNKPFSENDYFEIFDNININNNNNTNSNTDNKTDSQIEFYKTISALKTLNSNLNGNDENHSY